MSRRPGCCNEVSANSPLPAACDTEDALLLLFMAAQLLNLRLECAKARVKTRSLARSTGSRSRSLARYGIREASFNAFEIRRRCLALQPFCPKTSFRTECRSPEARSRPSNMAQLKGGRKPRRAVSNKQLVAYLGVGFLVGLGLGIIFIGNAVGSL